MSACSLNKASSSDFLPKNFRASLILFSYALLIFKRTSFRLSSSVKIDPFRISSKALARSFSAFNLIAVSSSVSSTTVVILVSFAFFTITSSSIPSFLIRSFLPFNNLLPFSCSSLKFLSALFNAFVCCVSLAVSLFKLFNPLTPKTNPSFPSNLNLFCLIEISFNSFMTSFGEVDLILIPKSLYFFLNTIIESKTVFSFSNLSFKASADSSAWSWISS